MRWATIVAACSLVMIVSGCSRSAAPLPDASTAPSPERTVTTGVVTTTLDTTVSADDTTRVSTPSTTVAVDTAEVTLRLGEVERLAARGGIAVAVDVSGVGAGILTDESPTLSVPVPIEVPTEASFTYVTAAGEPADVGWTQTLDAAGDAVVVVQPWRAGTDGVAAADVRLAWQTATDPAAVAAELDGAPSLTTVSPMTWFVDATGAISGDLSPATVERAADRNVESWPAVQGLDAEALRLLLSDPDRRTAAVDTISADARDAGAAGVNIDLEGFYTEDATGLTAFVEDMSAAVGAWGGVVSYDLVPRTDTWDVTPPDLAYWSTAPERRALAAAADITVLMAYDQHNRYRPAGPVAAPAWVEEAIIHAIRHADPHTIVLGIPGYGRVWDPADLTAPQAVPLASLDGLTGTAEYDPVFGMDRVTLSDGRFFWDERQVVAQRLSLVDEYGLAGVALWRLGFDDAALWEALTEG